MKKNLKEPRKYKIAAIIFALAFLAALAYIRYPSVFYSQLTPLMIPQLSTTGYVKVNVSADIVDAETASLTLSAKCYDLTASVEPLQAESILLALSNQVGPRPNAHDLARDVFTSLKIDVLMVKINERRESAFFAKIVLRQGNTVLNYDVRPSDGIAIALRMNAPIYINQTLLLAEGKKVC
jgi:bifunctional DNase/RNase